MHVFTTVVSHVSKGIVDIFVTMDIEHMVFLLREYSSSSHADEHTMVFLVNGKPFEHLEGIGVHEHSQGLTYQEYVALKELTDRH